MTTRAEVIAEARRWIGTRWRHQGRSEQGVDCVGLLVVVARRLSIVPTETLDDVERTSAGYSRYPKGDALRRVLVQHLRPVDVARPGDVLLFRIDAEPQHLAIVAEHQSGALSIVHAYAQRPRAVVETILDNMWRRRIVAAFSLPGVS